MGGTAFAPAPGASPETTRTCTPSVRRAVPLIRALRDQAEESRRIEVERAQKMLARGDDPQAVIEALSQGLTNKLMHAPTQALNEAGEEERRALADTLARLFRLRP